MADLAVNTIEGKTTNETARGTTLEATSVPQVPAVTDSTKEQEQEHEDSAAAEREQLPSAPPTMAGSRSLRPRRDKAGSKLPAILAVEKQNEDEDSQETIIQSASETSQTVTKGTAPGNDVGEGDNSQCCICNKVLLSNAITVSCRATQCFSIAHCLCAGYTEKGAKRAKFLCSSCRASLLLSQPIGRASKSPSPAPALASANSDNGKRKQTKCLCPKNRFCDNCISLQSLAKCLTESVEAVNKENKALHLHILKLEERLEALEKSVVSRASSSHVAMESLRSDITALKTTRSRSYAATVAGRDNKSNMRSNTPVARNPVNPSLNPGRSKTRVFRARPSGPHPSASGVTAEVLVSIKNIQLFILRGTPIRLKKTIE